MRTLRILTAYLLAVVCIGLSSCSKDDDGGIGSSDDLVGKWELIQVTGWVLNEDGSKEQIDETRSGDFCLFNSNGSGLFYTTSETNPNGKFTWKLSGDKLTMIHEKSEEKIIYLIETLNKSTLKITITEDDESYTANYRKIAD